jgi:hypothetical protein
MRLPWKRSITSTVLLPSPETKTLPFAEAKWSKRPFTPSSGTDAVKTIGGVLSAASCALAGAIGCELSQAVNVTTSARKEPMEQSFLMLSSMRRESNHWQDPFMSRVESVSLCTAAPSET